MNYYNSVIKELKINGFRLTRVRKAIVEELDLAKKPLSATEILLLLKRQGLKTHKTSVYRELNFMLNEGIVIKITFGEKQDRFELSALTHHHHAVCEKCGEVEDIDCSEGIKKIEEMLFAQNFKVNNHLVEFIGLCKNCR